MVCFLILDYSKSGENGDTGKNSVGVCTEVPLRGFVHFVTCLFLPLLLIPLTSHHFKPLAFVLKCLEL